MNPKLKKFLHALDRAQQTRFAKLAGTTVGTLRHYVSGRRVPKTETAIAMERAAGRMRMKGLPELTRADMSAACRGCEYRRRCVAADDEDLA